MAHDPVATADPTKTVAPRRVLAAIALVALVLRIVPVVWGVDVRRGPRDLEDRYDKIAHSLLQGQGFARGGSPTATSPPLYPLFLAGVYGAFGESKTALMLALAVLDAVTCALCAAVAWRLLGRDVGILAGLAVTFSPYNVYSVLLAGTDTLSIFLNWVAFFLVVRAVETRAGRWFLAAGVALGAAALCRASALLLPVFLVPLALVTRQLPWRRRIVHAAALVLGAVVLIAPWTVRNWIHFERFIPIQTLGGFHVMQGTPVPPSLSSPPAGGKSSPEANRNWKYNPANAGKDADYYKWAWQRIKANPFAYVWSLLRHVVTVWYNSQTTDFRWFLIPVNATLVALAALGIYMRRREVWRLAPLWLPIVYFVGIHTITLPSFRYILPIVPAMTTLAAIPVAWTLTRVRGRRAAAVDIPTRGALP